VPKSLSQLNQYSNRAIVYQDQRAYSIQFSANAAANTSTTIDEDQYFIVPTGIDIANVISQPGNITYNINLSNVANAILTWPAMPGGVTSSSNAGVYSITGIFSPETWATAKLANVIVPDREANFSFTANIQYPSTANTSVTNTWSWTNSVTIANVNPDVFFTQSYNFNEDSQTQIQYVIDDPDPTIVNYTVRVAPRAGTAGTIFLNGTNQGIGNAATITGNVATVQAANITYVPYPDDTNTVNLRADAYKTNGVGNVSVESNVSLTLTCIPHDDYSLTTAYNYAEDAMVPMVFDITDLDANVSSYTVRFTDATANAGVFFVDGVSQGVGNAVNISNSKVNINAANVSYLPKADYTGNVNLTYSQWKQNSFFGANIQQANNVPITMACTSTHSEYSMDTTVFRNNTTTPILTITDTDAYATNYVVSITAPGVTFYNNGVATANSLSLSNTKANINSANIALLSSSNANISLTYNQSKTNSFYGNITQVTGEVVTLMPLVSNMGAARSYYTNTATFVFADGSPEIGLLPPPAAGPNTPGINASNATRTLTVSTSNGYVAFGSNTAGITNTYSTTVDNSTFSNTIANIAFYPFANATSSSNITVVVSEAGTEIANTTITMSAIAKAVAPGLLTTTVYRNSTTINPPFVQSLYCKIDLLLVGSGGDGGGSGVFPRGGGGGGGVTEAFGLSITPGSSIPMTIGAGGAVTNTSCLGYTAGYGLDGTRFVSGSTERGDGAASGAPQSNAGLDGQGDNGVPGNWSGAGGGAGGAAYFVSGKGIGGGIGYTSAILPGQRVGSGGGGYLWNNPGTPNTQGPQDDYVTNNIGHGGAANDASDYPDGAAGGVVIKWRV
jgi:hypothetical protein